MAEKATLKGRTTDKFGNVIFDSQGLFDLIYSGNTDISGIPAKPDEEVEEFNHFMRLFDMPDETVELFETPDMSVTEFDKLLTSDWLMPEAYKTMDLNAFLLDKCQTEEETNRVIEEMTLFYERGLENLVRFMVYFVDTMREHKIVWGVGRGSSVASYVLYLIGVHKINSLEYNLPIEEFLK